MSKINKRISGMGIDETLDTSDVSGVDLPFELHGQLYSEGSNTTP